MKEFPHLDGCHWCLKEVKEDQNFIWDHGRAFHSECFGLWRQHCRKVKEEEERRRRAFEKM